VARTALHVVFFGEPRYHLPVLTVIVPMAAGALAHPFGRVATVLRS
jgi:hypothetical protein